MTRRGLVSYLCILFLSGCTTKLPDLGVSGGKFAACPDTPNCVNSQADNEDQEILPIILNLEVMEAKVVLKEVLSGMQNASIKVEARDYIRAEFTSSLFRFVDDVEFLFSDNGAGNTVIHMRSASRVGYSDFGANRERVELIRSKLSN